MGASCRGQSWNIDISGNSEQLLKGRAGSAGSRRREGGYRGAESGDEDLQKAQRLAWGLDLGGTLDGAGGVGGLLFEKNHYAARTFAAASDLNGNVGRLVDISTGQSAADYEYGPFGETIRASGEYAALNPFGFSSKYADWETGLSYFGYRFYNPLTGRWLSRDPMDKHPGQNMYGLADNDPIRQIDFLGLYTLDDAYSSVRKRVGPGGAMSRPGAIITDQQVFDEWHRMEQGRGSWWTSLPPCPKKLCITRLRGTIATNAFATDPSKWKEPKKPSNAEENLHPGAVWSLRSEPDGDQHANQCTYDENGSLLTTPPASGTVDWFESGTFPHYDHDVLPVYLANSLDGGGSMSLIKSQIFDGPKIKNPPRRQYE